MAIRTEQAVTTKAKGCAVQISIAGDPILAPSVTRKAAGSRKTGRDNEGGMTKGKKGKGPDSWWNVGTAAGIAWDGTRIVTGSRPSVGSGSLGHLKGVG